MNSISQSHFSVAGINSNPSIQHRPLLGLQLVASEPGVFKSNSRGCPQATVMAGVMSRRRNAFLRLVLSPKLCGESLELISKALKELDQLKVHDLSFPVVYGYL